MLLTSLPTFSYVQLFLFFILGSSIYKVVEGLGVYLKAKNRHTKNPITWCATISLWQGFLFLTMLQYFLALEKMVTDPGTSVGLGSMALHIISVLSLTILATLVTPDLNAPDVRDLMEEQGEYNMNEFFRRHRRTMPVLGFIFLASAAFNFPAIHGEVRYFSTLMPLFHGVFLAICLVLFLYGPKDPKSKQYPRFFKEVHRGIAVAAILLQGAIIFRMVG